MKEEEEEEKADEEREEEEAMASDHRKSVIRMNKYVLPSGQTTSRGKGHLNSKLFFLPPDRIGMMP